MTELVSENGTPSFLEFNPKLIPYQYRVIKNIKKMFKYDEGPHEIFLSGSIGSAKSCLIAWIVISHCTDYNGAVFLAEKMRSAVEELNIAHIVSPISDTVTISLGVSTISPVNDQSCLYLVDSADKSKVKRSFTWILRPNGSDVNLSIKHGFFA